MLETYADSEAAMHHMVNVGPQLGQLFEISDFSGEVYGEMSDELKAAIEGVRAKVYSFFAGK